MTQAKGTTNPIRFIACVFCDDIRHEKNDKDILIGVYGGSIVVPSFPARIMTCLWIQIEATASEQFRLELGIFRGDNATLAEAEFEFDTMPKGARAALALRGIPAFVEGPTKLALRYREAGTKRWRDVATVAIEAAATQPSAARIVTGEPGAESAKLS